MKVLMLGWELPPHNSGGLGVACFQLSKALADRGVDIEFVLPYTAEHPEIDFMKITAAHTQGVEQVLKFGNAYDSANYVKQGGDGASMDIFGQSKIYEDAIGKITNLGEFDIIHAHDWLTCRAAMRAKLLTGKPLVVHFHSIEADRSGQKNGGNPLVREIENLALLMADRVVAVSQHTKDDIVREYGISPDKIEVVHNHFDPAGLITKKGKNAYFYLEEMKKHGYKIIASIGRLTVQKGLPHLLLAFKRALERAPKTLLLIVGSGEQRNELVQLTADLDIAEKVLFVDFQRGKNYRDAYAIADLFVMPSVSEPFGLTALEAIGYGTPVLLSKQSGVSEVLKSSVVVDYWDTQKMTNKILELLADSDLRRKLHKKATQEYVEQSWEKSAEKILKIYKKHEGQHE